MGLVEADISRFAAKPSEAAVAGRSFFDDYCLGEPALIVHKWRHYLPLYERYFAPFRCGPVRMLEIGVQNGGSAQMWRAYFGPEAVIFGVDVDERCAALSGETSQVRIGSQADAGFLRAVVAEMGGVDIVLDDGSHQAAHIRRSFDVLFPLLSETGVYFIGDLHCAYWDSFGGGLRRSGNFFTMVRAMIDDMHGPYIGLDRTVDVAGGAVVGVHVHDSIAVIEKGRAAPPRDARFGGGAAQPQPAAPRAATMTGAPS